MADSEAGALCSSSVETSVATSARISKTEGVLSYRDLCLITNYLLLTFCKKFFLANKKRLFKKKVTKFSEIKRSPQTGDR